MSGMNVRFDDWEIDREALELSRAGERVELAPMAVRLLLLLTDNAGEIVTRDTLYDTLWPDGFVDRQRLVNTYMRQIRAALGENAGDDVFVRTYPRRGYRFLRPVTTDDHSESTPAEQGSSGRSGGVGRAARGLTIVAVLLVGATGALVARGVAGARGNAAAEVPAVAVGASERVDYLMGLELLDAPSPLTRASSVEHFRAAIAADPTFAPAQSGLAEGLFWSGEVPEAERVARTAITLDPDDVRAHLVLGSAALGNRWAWVEAEHHLRSALRGDPANVDVHVALGFLLVSSGRNREARTVLDEAVRLEPVSAVVTGDLGLLYGWIGLHREALTLCRRTIAIAATASWGHDCALEAARALGMADEVRARGVSLLALAGREAVDVFENEARVEQDVRRLREYQLEHSLLTSGFQRAAALAEVGRTTEAVAELERAAASREVGVVALAAHPALKTLVAEPGYVRIRDLVLAGISSGAGALP